MLRDRQQGTPGYMPRLALWRFCWPWGWVSAVQLPVRLGHRRQAYTVIIQPGFLRNQPVNPSGDARDGVGLLETFRDTFPGQGGGPNSRSASPHKRREVGCAWLAASAEICRDLQTRVC